MQSDNRTVTKIELATQQETKEQFNDQQKPESSGQRHHSPGVDGKSLEELLGLLRLKAVPATAGAAPTSTAVTSTLPARHMDARN